MFHKSIILVSIVKMFDGKAEEFQKGRKQWEYGSPFSFPLYFLSLFKLEDNCFTNLCWFLCIMMWISCKCMYINWKPFQLCTSLNLHVPPPPHSPDPCPVTSTTRGHQQNLLYFSLFFGIFPSPSLMETGWPQRNLPPLSLFFQIPCTSGLGPEVGVSSSLLWLLDCHPSSLMKWT